MGSKVKGSAFDFGDQGLFYSVIDYGARKTNLSGPNDAAIQAALAAMVTAGGGVLVIPQGILNTFDPLTDFPVTASPLMVWELTGNSFKLHCNQNIDADVGDTFAQAFFTDPSAVEYNIVDANPATYSYKLKVFDDAGDPVITGSSFDLCFFLPGGTDPVAAFARNGAKLGALHLFNGLVMKAPAQFEGAIQYTKLIEAPLTGASIVLADYVRYVVLDHAATIAALTITLPATPLDGQAVSIFSRSIVTALTLNAGAGETIAAGHTLTTLTALTSVDYMYDLATTSWYRIK